MLTTCSRSRLCAVLILLGCLPALAQTATPPERPQESEHETVAKSLEDLQSASVDDRKRAVLVLSKYRHPAAVAAIMRSLRDPDPQIRQSAVVAVVENNTFMQAGERFIQMLGDDDVHIRRIVSTFLQQAMMMQTMGIGARLSPESQRILRDSLRDPDATVRKNILKHFSFLRQYLSVEAILPLLKDDDRDIRMLTLEQAWQLLMGEPERFAAQTRHLINDPDDTIRLQLAQALTHIVSGGTRDLLLELTNDQAFDVRLHAQLALVRQGEHRYVEPLVQALADHRMRQEMAERIISSFGSTGNTGQQALLALLKHEKPFYRMTALRTLGRNYRQDVKPELLIAMLDDPFAPVRQEAGMLLRMTQTNQRPANMHQQILGMIGSRFTDVREIAVDLAAQQQGQAAEELLMEALLDEAPQVRGKAIQYIVGRRFQGWQEIVRISLQDGSEQVRVSTVHALLNSPADDTRQMVHEIYANTQDEAIRRAIEQRLGATF